MFCNELRENMMQKLNLGDEQALIMSLDEFMEAVKKRHQSIQAPLFFACFTDFIDVCIVIYNYVYFCDSSTSKFWSDLVTLVSIFVVLLNMFDVVSFRNMSEEASALRGRAQTIVLKYRDCSKHLTGNVAGSNGRGGAEQSTDFDEQATSSSSFANFLARSQKYIPLETRPALKDTSRRLFVCADEISENTLSLVHWYGRHRNNESFFKGNGKNYRALACVVSLHVGGVMLRRACDPTRNSRCLIDISAGRIKQLNLIITNPHYLDTGSLVGAEVSAMKVNERILEIIQELYIPLYIMEEGKLDSDVGKFQAIVHKWLRNPKGVMWGTVQRLLASDVWSKRTILLESDFSDDEDNTMGCLPRISPDWKTRITDFWVTELKDEYMAKTAKNAASFTDVQGPGVGLGQAGYTLRCIHSLIQKQMITIREDVKDGVMSDVVSRTVVCDDDVQFYMGPDEEAFLGQPSADNFHNEDYSTLNSEPNSPDAGVVLGQEEEEDNMNYGAVGSPKQRWFREFLSSMVSDALPCMLNGYCSYRFFLCFLHIGKPDYNEGYILLLSLLVVVYGFYMLKVKFGFATQSTVVTALAACVGGAYAWYTLAPDLTSETYLGLAPHYNLSRSSHAHLVPLVYAVMHVCLIVFALLPLTMCRMLIRAIMYLESDFLPSCFPSSIAHTSFLTRFFHLHDLYACHRFLGYTLCCGLYVGAASWWVALYFSCAQYGVESECAAFLPVGSFFDIRGAPWFCNEADLDKSTSRFRDEVFDYDDGVFNESGNAGAVLFLRILVTLAVCTMLLTSTLKYPLSSKSSSQLSFPYTTRFWKSVIEPNSFEIFMYAHVLGADAIAAGAFFSRFEVFYPTFFFWVLFAVDKFVAWLSISELKGDKVHWPSHVAESASILQLRLQMRGSVFKFKAGQVVYLRCWQLSMFEWHPFSIASCDSDDELRLLIKINKAGSWTQRLQQVLVRNSLQTLSVKGPFGSTFQDLQQYDFIMLIGTSTGIAGALSVVDDVAHNRNSSTKVWFVWSTRDLSDVKCVARDIRKSMSSSDKQDTTETRIRATIHVTAKERDQEIANLREEAHETVVDDADADELDVEHYEKKSDLRFVSGLLRSGRPVWKTYFQSFAASCVISTISKGKICICTSQSAIMADVRKSLDSVDFPDNVDIEFTSENFQ